jgi:F420-dependent oxidoreductase-like protein
VDYAIMIEGQNGVNWENFQRLAYAVEELGFAGLYRSDHFVNTNPPDQDSLELWVSLTWLASHTKRIEFGPMVSPVSFRHPVFTARIAKDVDDLSGGRLTLGVGAGWMEREHRNFGFDLLDVPGRFARFEEGLEVISRLLKSAEPATYEGKHYQLQAAQLLPRPQRPNGPPILIGGNGERRTLPLVAKYADEWNGVFIPADRYAALNRRLDELLEAAGRPVQAVKRSIMTRIVYGTNEQAVKQKLTGADPEKLRERGVIVGVGDEVVEPLQTLAAAGAQRVMLQWLELDDLDGLAALAQTLHAAKSAGRSTLGQ